MDTTSITCPNCQTDFELSEAIEKQISARLKEEHQATVKSVEASFAKRVAELEAERESASKLLETRLKEEREKISKEQALKAEEAVSVQIQDFKNQLSEKEEKLAAANAIQLNLLKEKRQFDLEKQSFELEKAKQIEAEREKIRKESTVLASEQFEATKKELEQRLAIKDQKLLESQEQELRLRKERIEFEEQKKSFELQLARNAEEVRGATQKAKDEEYRLKEAENHRQMEALNKTIDELKRRVDQGSQQSQGEVLELDLENNLRACFSSDEILPIAKGVSGADVLQKVRDPLGRECGSILWETKRTKAWSDGWLSKLKDDMLAIKSPVAILVTTAMPKDVTGFDCRDGVWIVPPNLAFPLAAALRTGILEAASSKLALEGRHDKMEAVYSYLAGSEFRGRIEAIVTTFESMRSDLEAEKRAYQKIWSKREKQIERVIGNTARMYGDLQGIIGGALPQIPILELDFVGNEVLEELEVIEDAES